jgi:ATP-dependent DNA helicase RecG
VNKVSILQRSVLDLKGVGQQLATRLAQLQIKTFQDVLFHLPHRYVDRTRIYPLATVRIDDLVVIEGVIEKTSIVPKPKRSLIVKIRDSTAAAELKFFHFNLGQQAQLIPGATIRCFGQVRRNRNGLQFIHPEYKIIDPAVILPVEEYLTPIYPTADGITQKFLRNLVQQVIGLMQPIQSSLEMLPQKIIQELEFSPLIDSLQQVHFPTPECYKHILNTGYHPAQRRLAFEELLAHHITLRQKRQRHMAEQAYPIHGNNILRAQLIANLPFVLTVAQQQAIATILQDLSKPCPMLRLVQGDVGSGKTLVAVVAALAVIEAGMQVAFMAPTEILAEQHYQNIQHWFAPLGIETACLTGKLTAKEKAEINLKINSGQVKLAVGTHALFQDTVEFNNLALVIIDEQHRFGVAQRLALHNKGRAQEQRAHQLILTATPIPRTLAMTFYADLDYSVIDELPPGRKPITTVMVSADRRAEILTRIANICAQGQQVYWVCTLIEESEVLDCTAAENAWQELQAQLPSLKIALIHGRMKPKEKEEIMIAFKAGTIHLLVATTVIEVGVDVPNASLMVIENPERLGLAQLHQLRGRVGRGANQSFCVFLYKKPLGEKASQRLQFLRDSQDGFAIAEFDLKLRGPGEVFGTRQSGLANLRIADLMRDKDLLPKVHTAAEVLLREYADVVPALLGRWLREQVQYAVV